MVIVGFKKVVAKSNGVSYTELHLLCDDRFITGQRCDVVFVRDDMISNLELLDVGVCCQIFYNRFGKPESINLFV